MNRPRFQHRWAVASLGVASWVQLGFWVVWVVMGSLGVFFPWWLYSMLFPSHLLFWRHGLHSAWPVSGWVAGFALNVCLYAVLLYTLPALSLWLRDGRDSVEPPSRGETNEVHPE